MANVSLKHVKIVTAKGKRYYYFDTGLTKPNGARLYVPLPHPETGGFGVQYAHQQGLRRKRERKVELFSVADAVRYYEASERFAKKAQGTQQKYLIYMKRMARKFTDPRIGSWPVVDIAREDVRRFLEDLGPGAQNLQLAVLREVLKLARKHDKIPHDFDPTKEIDNEHKATPHEPWPEWLIEKALADPDMRLPVALLYFTGQRIGAVVRMKWTDIDEGIIHVPPHKTSGDLYITLHVRLLALLAEYERSLTTIIHKNGKPLTADALRERIKTWLRAQGQGHLVPHGLRKNAVNALLQSGSTIAEVKGVTDQSMKIIEHYADQIDKKRLAKQAIGKWESS